MGSNHKIFSKLFILMLLSSGIYATTPGMKADSVAAKKESSAPKKPMYLPIISIAEGMMSFNGDVGYNRLNQPFTANSGVQFELQFQSSYRISLALFLLSGKAFGEEKTINRAANFRSSIVSEGIMLRYDFLSKKNDDQVLIPFITAGIEYLVYRTYSDLKDAQGRYYQYWDDGTIRDIAQDDPNSDQSILIHRDYTYESDLRDANLDGLGKYSTNTIGLPVGIGFRFQMTSRFSMHFSSVCHFTGSDLIDGISQDGKGQRKGDSKMDKIIYSSVSLRFALSSPKESAKAAQITSLVYEDADGDGITDLDDDSSSTPRSNPVTPDGKPYDLDNDGIPDYRDKELKTAVGAVVNENGVTITEAMIEEKFKQDSLAALPAVIEYLNAYDKMVERNPEAENKPEPNNNARPIIIPQVYEQIDADQNGVISPREISSAIDVYLARQSPYNVNQFFDLIDFFFSQR